MTLTLSPPPITAAPTVTEPPTPSNLAKLKRQVVGSSRAKEAILKSGEVHSLVALLVSGPAPHSEDSLARSAEAATVLATLSLPSLTAVSILLSSSAHTRLVSSLTAVLHSVSSPSPHTSLTTQAKTVECHLRALKSLFSDLVAVVGPRAWGTQVVGASIDVEERRDAEGLWEVPVGVTGGKLPASGGKGKGKEGDLTMGESLAGAGGVDLERLQRDAQVALDAVFRQPMALESHSSGSSSSRPAPALLPSLISVLSSLTPSSSSTASPTSLPLTTRLRLADLICSFLAGVVRLPEQRFVLTDDEQGRAVLTALRGLVEEGSDKVKESALNALTAVLRESPDAMLTLLNLGTGISYASRLTPFTSLLSSSLPSLRLAASTLCAVIAKLIYPPPEMQIPTEGQGDFGVGLVVGLLGLIEREKELRGKAAFTFAFLVADEPKLQERAIASRALQIFHDILSQPMLLDQPYPTPKALEDDGRMREGILLSIAALSALLEPHRRYVLDALLLPHLLTSLSHPLVGVRAAACHCVRGLSRSVNVLRTDLVEQQAEERLVWLLREEENEVVKITASAAVGNLLLEFSPMREVLVEAGCVPRMCALAVRSTNPTLRLNAMWAIKNATYNAPASFKRSVLEHLTWDDLATLIASPLPPIAEQALGLLRNITCVTNNEPVTGLGAAEMGEERLLGLLEGKIANGGETKSAAGDEGVVQALYCVSNIATANEAAQLAIASRTTLLRYVLSYLNSRCLPLRTASLWLLHNLIYRRGYRSHQRASASGGGGGGGGGRRPEEIVDKLRALGLEGKLRMLERDGELDVRERVKDLREAMGA